MDELLKFIGEHWLLWSALALIALAFIALEVQTRMGGEQIAPEKVVDMINHDQAVLFDVRPQENFAKGHIVNAIHLPLADIEANSVNYKQHQDKPVIVVCQLGRSAVGGAMQFRKAGFTKVYVLQGGMQAWLAAKLPETTN